MRFALCGWVAMALLLPGVRATGWAQDSSAQGRDAANPEPQIVRVSFVEGDVRVSRGKDARKKTRADWEKAAVDLPVESGYSLVTGDGRAEVEFEDSSVIYLAENSVLVFNELYTSNGIPQTNIALLSGTMSINVKPVSGGETFLIQAPKNKFSVPFPMHTYARLTSFLDGLTATSLGNEISTTSRAPAGLGHTITYQNGKRTLSEKTSDQGSYTAFDQWVMERAIARNNSMAETMKEAGLSQPIPGLAQLKGQGHFFPCPPYGTCWEPTNGWAGQMTEPEKAAMARQTVSVAALTKGGAKNNKQRGNAAPSMPIEDPIVAFPCSPIAWNNQYQVDPSTGRRMLIGSGVLPAAYGFGSLYPYQWAVCHSGSWLQNQGRYVWVTGVKHHPYPPVHWMKTGHTVGFVPIHPGDTTGKLPINVKNGIVHPVEGHSLKVEMVDYSGSDHIKTLNEAPKQFRRDPYVALQRADTPRAEARMLRGPGTDNKVSGSTPITFDSRSQSFMVPRPSSPNAPTGTSQKMEPIGGRGSELQMHAGGGSEMRGPNPNAGGGNFSRGGSAPSGGFGGGGGQGLGGSQPSSAPAPAPSPAPASPVAPSGGQPR